MSPARSALLIGADTFQDNRLPQLRGAVADVEAVAEVLGDPIISDFATKIYRNAMSYRVADAIEGFFADADFADFLILYISGHGLKDDSGRLYFAATDTRPNRLGSSAISSTFVLDQMIKSRSRRIFVVLDCCFSGAFTTNRLRRSHEDMDSLERLAATGCAIITSSASLEYSFDTSESGDASSVPAEKTPSVFTQAFIRGLRTGEADLNCDGLVEVCELYEYLRRMMRSSSVQQTPTLSSELDGPFYVAYSRAMRLSPTAEMEQSDPSPDSDGQERPQVTVDLDSSGA
ncbi:MAG: caspase family protein, partial [Pseudonocardia sp.]|nr:caspase family protein [Pseudonocardia sp.]